MSHLLPSDGLVYYSLLSYFLVVHPGREIRQRGAREAVSGTHCPAKQLIFGNDSGMSEGSQGPAGTCVCGSQQVLVRTGHVWTAVLSGVSPGSGTCSQITAGGLVQHVGPF